MKKTKSIGLRLEIIVSLVFLVAAAAGVDGRVVVFRQAQREMVSLKIETGLVLARALEVQVGRSDSRAAQQRLIQAMIGEGFERIIVVDNRGAALASFGPWPWEDHPNPPDLHKAMAARETVSFLPRWSLLTSSDPTVALAIPLFSGSRVVGAVGLFSSLPEMRATWIRIQWTILIFLGLDTLVTVGFGTYLLSHRFVRPLRKLLVRFEDLAAGRYEPSVKTGPENEIGLMETSFEAMAERLLESQARLRENIETIRQAQDRLIRSEKMASVGRLAAGLAHELGNPLGSLLGFVHLLGRDDLDPADRADFLARMESEITRMDGIIRSLLDFARPVKTEVGPVDLDEVVRSALALARVQKWCDGLEIVQDLEADLPPVRAEKNRLTQVLLNLMANAGQAMAGQGRLTLTTGTLNGGAVVAVKDTGPGLSPEEIDRIFEPFYTSKDPGEGTGLGLSVSLSIVESFGGRIDVESRPGRGASFKVWLAFNSAEGN